VTEPRPTAFGATPSISVAVKTIHFCDGSTEDLGPTDVVAVVGANSAGKTQFLKDLYEAVQGMPGRAPQNMWANEVELDQQGDEVAFRTWFDERARYLPSPRPEPLYAISHRTDADGGGTQLEYPGAWHAWSHPQQFWTISRYMVKYLGAADRGRIQLTSRPARNPMESPHEPLHHLWDSWDAEDDFSRLVEQAFGFPVCVNRHERSSTTLLKGRPHDDYNSNPPSREALDWYANLPWLGNEGDGVRAFIGIMLETVAARPLMTFVDEPETFLHPRHAKLIGRHLVEHTAQSGQVFIATHSEDVLQGILDGRTSRNVKVIRLDRTTGAHPALDPDRVRALWTKPILRYSRLLTGLFHRGLVICEADNDARFYEAHLDALVTDSVDHDLSLTHLDGWGRFDKALTELRTLGIPSAVIGDFDVLREPAKLKKLVEAAQGDYSKIATQVNVIQTRVDHMGGGPRTGPVLNAVKPLQEAGRTPGTSVSKPEKDAISNALRGESGWEQMKRSGKQSLRGSEAADAAPHVLEYLEKIGIFVVPVGDLEAWYALSSRKGAETVIKVLEEDLHSDPPPELKKFLTRLLSYFQVRHS
jgi:hypothetical protein